MKFLKFSALFLMLVSASLFFYSCEETTSTGDNPVIDSVTPDNGAPGTEVTITGSKFGDYNAATSKVYFNGELAISFAVQGNEIQWFDDEIVVKVPEGATTGNVVVEADGLQSNGVMFTVPTVAPPTNLVATSKDDKSVSLKWTASADADITGYELYVYPVNGTVGAPIQITKTATSYLASGLNEGTVYNFDLNAVKNNVKGKASVQWSPASRFDLNINDEDIKMYETASSFGSGLQLYDATGAKPKTLKTSSGADWDLGIFTSGNSVWFGTAAKMKARYPSSFTATAKTCQIAANQYFFNSLDELFDSQALSGQNFTDPTKQEIDLSTLTGNTNVIFIVRTNSPTWNYAKVMLIYDNGFLQGTTGNKYVQAKVSYQKTAGTPYAI